MGRAHILMLSHWISVKVDCPQQYQQIQPSNYFCNERTEIVRREILVLKYPAASWGRSMYLQEIETKSKKLGGEFHSVKNTMDGFLLTYLLSSQNESSLDWNCLESINAALFSSNQSTLWTPPWRLCFVFVEKRIKIWRKTYRLTKPWLRFTQRIETVWLEVQTFISSVKWQDSTFSISGRLFEKSTYSISPPLRSKQLR